MTGHFIICGWGRVGRASVLYLDALGKQVVVVDRDPARLQGLDYPTLLGGIADSAALRQDSIVPASVGAADPQRSAARESRASAMRHQDRRRTPQYVEADHAISKRNEICALTAADHVCGAHETRVVRTNDVAKMERIVRIGNGQPDEAFLPVSPPAVGVARRGVPGRGGDDLIVGDLARPGYRSSDSGFLVPH